MMVVIDDGLGNARPLGNRRAPDGFQVPCYGGVTTLDPSQWEEFELDLSPAKVKDQNGKGACNGHAAATAMEIARWIAGMDHVDLSAWYVYAILCNGVDRGSSIAEALTLSSERGIPPESVVPYGTINPRRLSTEAHEQAKRFRLEIGSGLRTFADLMTATQMGRPGNFSLCVGRNFNTLDADGCPGITRGPGNHALTFGLGAKRGRDGKWLIKGQNSWSTRWGDNGYFWFSEDHMTRQSYFDAYDIAAVLEDPTDPRNTPVAIV